MVLHESIVLASPIKDKGGRVRTGWTEHAREQVGQPVPTLRACAQKWLEEKGIQHTTLHNSSDKGLKTVLCKSKACEECDREYCFRLMQPGPEEEDAAHTLLTEQKGSCSCKKDLVQRKLQMARKYAAQHSSARAIKRMLEAQQGNATTKET